MQIGDFFYSLSTLSEGCRYLQVRCGRQTERDNKQGVPSLDSARGCWPVVAKITRAGRNLFVVMKIDSKGNDDWLHLIWDISYVFFRNVIWDKVNDHKVFERNYSHTSRKSFVNST